MNKVLICSVFVPVLVLTACSEKKNDINYGEITGESSWQGITLATESEDFPVHIELGKLYNGVFYWSEREAVKDGIFTDVRMPEIKNGRYYFTDGEGYVEISDNKYFRLIDFDEERLTELEGYYKAASYGYAIYENEEYDDTEYTEDEKNTLQNKIQSSNQIQTLLVDNRAEFFINPVHRPYGPYDTDIELTTELSDYEMWFPLLYFYDNEEYKLVYVDKEWEFIYEEDK